MKTIFLIVLFFICGNSFSQIKNSGIIKKAGNFQAFIPVGYDTLTMVRGDLDKDKKPDIVMVLKHELEQAADLENIDPDSIPSRILMILFGRGNGFELSVASGAVIMCKHCGGVMGDPFQNLRIEKGILIIEHYGGSAWRWGYTHKFRYQNNAFFLIGRSSISYWNVAMCENLGEFAATEFEDVNFVTGAYPKKKISQEGCKLLENKKGKTKVRALVKMNNFSIEKKD